MPKAAVFTTQSARRAEESPSPRVCLTIGDSTGIGPEITVKFLTSFFLNQAEPTSSLIILGDINALENEARRQGYDGLPTHPQIRYNNRQADTSQRQKPPGQIAYDSLEAAIQEIHEGRADILVTGPISKEQLHAAQLPYSGHTEILQHLARHYYQQPYQSDMLFLYQDFRMLLLTRHVSLHNVSTTLSVQGVIQSLDNVTTFLKEHCHLKTPRLCILGVNPHAGEIDGDEEERILKPALRAIEQKHGYPIAPPVAADAAFRHFDVNSIPYDAYIAAYHDQGLIPFKMVAGLDAVNVTIGLPFLRTSVSHGTAPDIVGQGLASPQSLISAYKTALALLSAPQQTPAESTRITALSSTGAR